MFFVPVFLFAAIGDNGISVAPDGTQLKWEEGAWDFFIMHKTLIDHVTGEANKQQNADGSTTDTTDKNPQGDTFIDSSTYTLTSKHIPLDADIDRAFLVWLSTQDPNNLSGPTDNSVTLTFKNSTNPAITLTQDVTASFQGNLGSTTIGNFEYEALNMPADAQSGATGVYTYRVEVSDFMKKIIEMGEKEALKPGEALYGDYTVSGMDGSNHENYLGTSGLVGGWFLPFIYTSSNISAKKIYIYNGLAAYRFENKELTVSGFELPDEAVIKLGLVVFEGDPGLAMTINLNMQPAEAEGLYIRSEKEIGDDTKWAPLYNKCNPTRTLTDEYSGFPYNGGTLNYTEMYNSISSVFSWSDPSDYWCVGNPDKLWPIDPTNPLEYAIDADILMVDSSPTGDFANKFLKGEKSFQLKIGANQDQVYTNLLIVSVDTKLPDFDIPNEREKEYCSCADKFKEADAICADRPFYYMVKIQNWGQNAARDIKFKDTLPAQVEYVAGTTEIATKFDASGNGTDWTPVPDDPNGGFPYAAAKLVSDKLEHCGAQPCQENTTVWVRFVVQPKSELSKNEVIKNSADIISEGGVTYHTNSNIPLRLTLAKDCPAKSECELPPKTQCGGIRIEGNENYCTEDKDCKDGKKCINNECQADASGDLTENAAVSFGIGLNSPGKGDKTDIIIPNPSDGLVLGQFYLLSQGSDANKFYNFDSAEFEFTTKSDGVISKNFKLYKDENGDGKVDEGDKEIAKAEGLTNSKFIHFDITDPAFRLTAAEIKHHFIVVADVSSPSGKSDKFSTTLDSGSITVTDKAGRLTVSGDKIEFANYTFEPSEGFVFTKGTFNPPVPSFKDFNGEHEVLQARTKSIALTNRIKQIKITVPSSSVRFGEGIKSVSLILDNDGNGIESDGDTLIEKVEEFPESGSVTLKNFGDKLNYAENEEKFLIFKLKFSMDVKQKAQIKINKVTLEQGDAVGVPFSSNEFVYECDATDPNACGGDSDDGGCSLSEIPENDSNPIYIFLAAFAAMIAFAAFRFSSKNN